VPQREFVVTLQQPCAVLLRRHAPVPINGRTAAVWNRPGVYIIYDSGREWYVGVGTVSINDRFEARLKALRDFNIPVDSLTRITVSAVSLESYTPNCMAVQERRAGSTVAPRNAKTLTGGILQVVEQHLISRYRTHVGRGNGKGEPVWLQGTGQLAIRVVGPGGQVESDTVLTPKAGSRVPAIESRKNRA
jgi:hypothetical protein